MRILAFALLLSCASSSSSSSSPPLSAAPVDPISYAPVTQRRYLDAGVDAPLTDAHEVTAAEVTSDNPPARPTVADVLAWNDLDSEPSAVAVAAAEAGLEERELERTTENGISVVYVEIQPWCGMTSAGVFCFNDRAECGRKARSCRASNAAACVQAMSRTTSETTLFCKPSYGECQQLAVTLSATEEYTVGDCSVGRYRKP